MCNILLKLVGNREVIERQYLTANKFQTLIYFLNKFILLSSPFNKRKMFFLCANKTNPAKTTLNDNNQLEEVCTKNFSEMGNEIAASIAPSETY
jgi:hypothetical protein